MVSGGWASRCRLDLFSSLLLSGLGGGLGGTPGALGLQLGELLVVAGLAAGHDLKRAILGPVLKQLDGEGIAAVLADDGAHDDTLTKANVLQGKRRVAIL